MHHAAVFFGNDTLEKIGRMQIAFSQRARSFMYSETVDFDLILGDTEAFLLVDQKFMKDFTLVTLQLDDLTEGCVFNYGAIAGKVLLDHLQYLLWIVFFGKPLEGRQGLSTIALLDTYVNITAGSFTVVTGPFAICKRIEGFEIFDGGHKLLLFRKLGLR